MLYARRKKHINNRDTFFKALDACTPNVNCILTSLDEVHHSYYTSIEGADGNPNLWLRTSKFITAVFDGVTNANEFVLAKLLCYGNVTSNAWIVKGHREIRRPPDAQ